MILVDEPGCSVGVSGGGMPDNWPLPRPTSSPSSRRLGLEGDRSVRFLDRRHGRTARWCLTPELVRRILLAGDQPVGRRRHAAIYARGGWTSSIVRTAPSRNAVAGPCVFFSKSPTKVTHCAAPGSSGSPRESRDREPEAQSQVGEAQLVALAKWGGIPATRSLRQFEEDQAAHPSRRQRQGQAIKVLTINSYHLFSSIYRMPG